MFRPIVLPDTFNPREYQRDYLDCAMELIESKPDIPHLFSSPTGTGKTWMQLMTMEKVPESILMTPRLEIIAGALEKLGHYVEDMAPDKLASLAWQYGIITPIRFRSMLAEGRLDVRPRLLIKDECFPAGTMVETEHGPIAIDRIKVGQSVLTYDATNDIISTSIVTRTFKNPAPEKLVEVSCNGRIIICTEGHPFFTLERGWVIACELTTNDSLCVLWGSNTQPKEESKRQTQERKTELLSTFMYGQSDTKRTIQENEPNKQGSCISANEETKPNGKRSNKSEGFQDSPINGAQTSGTQGQWTWVDPMRDFDSIKDTRTETIQGEDGNKGPVALQDRSCYPLHHVSGRSGRIITWAFNSAGTRQTKDRISHFYRVDSIKVYKQGSEGETTQRDRFDYVYNIEVAGTHTYIVNDIVVHNCHHDEADSWKDIDMYLNGVPQIGLTATPYRGTPRGTQAFLSKWNNTVNQVLSLKDAVERGFYQIPKPILWPMIDDDLVEVTNGDFRVKSLESEIFDRIKAIAEKCRQFYSTRGRMYDMPTLVAFPSSATVNKFCEECREIGLPVVSVTQATTRQDRVKAFRACVDMTHMLVQINVVSEGVDLPIKRIIDVKSTLSPVHWMQQVGRIRPDPDFTPEYICCNRNLERHGYLMEGLLPSSTFKEAQEVFGKPSKRAGSRGVGIEGLGKFKAIPVRLKDGVTVQCYNLTQVDEWNKTEYFIIVHPAHADTVQGKRVIPKKEDGSLDYAAGRWKMLDEIPEMQGYQSAKPWPLTDKQKSRWDSDAEKVGLDPHQVCDARSIQVFFFLRDTRIRFK